MLELNNLSRVKSFTKKAKLVGRGGGSGKGGHTTGRGGKGQTARAGGKRKPHFGFEGGQASLVKRLPKLRGFSRGFDKEYNVVISLSSLNKFNDGDTVSVESLKEKNIIKNVKENSSIKILNNGKLEKKLEVVGIVVSKDAKEQIEKLGGSIK